MRKGSTHDTVDLTVKLQKLISAPFKENVVEEAMNLAHLGAELNTLASNGSSLLHVLSNKKNNKNGQNDPAIKSLVEIYHANIDIEDAEGFTSLQRLITGPFIKEAAMNLVRLGANPNREAKNGRSLLHILAKKENNRNGKNNEAITELVKSHNAIIDIEDAEGFAPLQRLINNLSFDIEAVMMLVRLGANPDTKDANGRSLLHLLLSSEDGRNGKNNGVIKELVKVWSANIDIKDAEGFTPFQRLISNATFTTNAAMNLIDLGADSAAKNSKDFSLIRILSGPRNNLNGKNDEAIKKLKQLASQATCRTRKLDSTIVYPSTTAISRQKEARGIVTPKDQVVDVWSEDDWGSQTENQFVAEVYGSTALVSGPNSQFNEPSVSSFFAGKQKKGKEAAKKPQKLARNLSSSSSSSSRGNRNFST